MKSHIEYQSGKVKTVCATACLTALGVPFNGFQVTGSIAKANYLQILNKFGFSTRSRKSYMPKNPTIGKCRKAIQKLDENAAYLIVLKHAGYCHAIVVDNVGKTIVDTDPRKMDKRKVYSIHAVTRL